MRHDGDGRHDAKMYVGEEGRGDQYAVEHVVQGVTHQHQSATRLLARLLILMSMAMMIPVLIVPVRIAHRVFDAVIVMAVAPEQEFLEHEEQRDAGDERDAHRVHVLHARALHRVRDERQQGRA